MRHSEYQVVCNDPQRLFEEARALVDFSLLVDVTRETGRESYTVSATGDSVATALCDDEPTAKSPVYRDDVDIDTAELSFYIGMEPRWETENAFYPQVYELTMDAVDGGTYTIEGLAEHPEQQRYHATMMQHGRLVSPTGVPVMAGYTPASEL